MPIKTYRIMKPKLIFCSLLVAVLMHGCSSSQKIIVQHIDDIDITPEYNYVYALPMTILNIELKATRINIEKGEYAEHAKKYLDLKNVYHSDKQLWKLKAASINQYREADPKQYYLVKQAKDQYQARNQLIDLASEGLIFQVNQVSPGANPKAAAAQKNKNKQINNENIPVSGNLAEVTDTLYKTLYQDSAFVRVPFYHNRVLPKNEEQKAKETAALLLKLKQREIQLITGEDDFYPPEKSLRYGIEEIRKMQQQLLRLFKGTKTEKQVLSNYPCIPDSCANDTIIICRFNQQEGFISKSKKDGDPVYCSIISSDKTKPLKKLQNREKGKNIPENTIFYRIPDVATVRIFFKDKTVASQKVLIDQFGTVIGRKL